MPTATTTKQPTKATTKTTKAAQTPTPAETNGDKPQAPNGDGKALTAAYWKAIDKRNDKGEIPAAQLAAVKAAYTQTAPQKRANLVKALNLEAADRIMNAKGEFDQTIAKARLVLSETIDKAREETTRSERPAHDPVPDLARVFAALDSWRAEATAGLTPDQVKALAAYKVDPNDEETKALATRVTKALATIRTSALSGRKGYSGHRASATDIAAKVRKAVDQAHPEPLTTTQLAKAAGLSQATAYTRHTANNTPGVKATKDKDGRMVFVKDTQAA